ncbi:MAG: hypothetical protein Hals2KO_00950 [Halioglobus sp.]
MTRLPTLFAATLLLAGLHVPCSTAQIYKWVDEDGNVHFGDRPQDKRTASQAEEVEVREAYKPSEQLSEQEKAVTQSEAALKKSQSIRRQEERERAEAEKTARAKQEKALNTACAKLEAEYRKFTELHIVGGRPTYYFITGDDGKSVSESEQRAYIEELRQKGEDEGCDGFSSDD